MPRANAMVPPDAIRIEDEVWQEAFTRREPGRPSRERKLRAIERDPADWLMETSGRTLAEAPATALPLAPPRPGPTDTPASTDALPARRTVKIQGRGAERNLPLPQASGRRPPRRAYERTGFRPDRLAMWAVMLGFVLVLIAIVSAHA